MISSAAQTPTVIVPVKGPDGVKSRLEPSLGQPARRALSLMLLHHVLRCVSDANAPLHIWVVGGDAQVRRVAMAQGARWLGELGCDLNDTLWQAINLAFELGSPASIYLPIDLPFLRTTDIDALVQSSNSYTKVVICPALRDGGTNGLLLPSVLAFPPRLGVDSFARHVKAATSLGYPYSVLKREGISFDLDTPSDLIHCKETIPAFADELVAWQPAISNAALEVEI